MIQRIQSIFLALCTITFGAFMFIPLKEIAKDFTHHKINALSVFNTEFTYTMSFSVVSGLLILSAVTSAIALFSYKKRYIQIRLCYFIILNSLIILSLLDFTNSVVTDNNTEIVSWIANVAFLATVIFAFLASHFIKKDINLLKSADRIR